MTVGELRQTLKPYSDDCEVLFAESTQEVRAVAHRGRQQQLRVGLVLFHAGFVATSALILIQIFLWSIAIIYWDDGRHDDVAFFSILTTVLFFTSTPVVWYALWRLWKRSPSRVLSISIDDQRGI